MYLAYLKRYNEMDKVAIFVRVSKGEQDYNRQIQELTACSKVRGYEVVSTITEKLSGAKLNKERAAINELLHLAQQKKIRHVLVSEVSRLGRNTSEVLKVLEQLTVYGVSAFVHNYNLETLSSDGTKNPIAQFLFTMLAEFARLERDSLIQRINSGLDEARRKGKKLGRPHGSKTSDEDLIEKHKHVARQLRKGKSIRDIAAICNVGSATVQKVKRAMINLNEL
jgi:DNA invertase Pin-like site-specific DNA recombinase